MVMPISDPHDRFFYPHHAPIKDTYNHSLTDTEFQIRRGNRDNSDIISLSPQLKHVLTPHLNPLDKKNTNDGSQCMYFMEK